MPTIHDTAIVKDGAELASNVSVGPFSIISDETVIESGTTVEARVTTKDSVHIGKNNHIYEGTVIGSNPQDWSYEDIETGVQIGSGNEIREYVTIHKSTTDGNMTVIGDDNMIMAYCHVAHDCVVGDDIDMANGATLAGHVTVGDHAIVSGKTGFHQFVQVGSYSIVGGLSRISKDVVPFSRVSGIPAEVYGLNSVGLRRHGFSSETRNTLKKVFKILFRDGNNTSQAVSEIREKFSDREEIQQLLEFIDVSERGIHK